MDCQVLEDESKKLKFYLKNYIDQAAFQVDQHVQIYYQANIYLESAL